MRLGQLARKYDIPVLDIISFLESETLSGEAFHPNSKLDESTELQVFNHFEILPEIPEKINKEEFTEPEEEFAELEEEFTKPEEEFTKPEEESTEPEEESTEPEEEFTKPEAALPETPLDDIASVEGEIEPGLLESTRIVDEPIPEDLAPKEDEVIQTDKLLELLESEEDAVNLDKIKLIKAPKKELSGLKVLGKLELPETKKKPDSKDDSEKKEQKSGQSAVRREEEREKRRLEAKRKQEVYDNRQEIRRKEREKKERKKRKEAHYQQNLQKVKTKQVKQDPPQQVQPPIIEKEDQHTQSKTLLGKFWRWMNMQNND